MLYMIFSRIYEIFRIIARNISDFAFEHPTGKTVVNIKKKMFGEKMQNEIASRYQLVQFKILFNYIF